MTGQTAKLCEPARVAGIDLSNHIVMAPMTRARADIDTAVPIPETATYYAQRASAGLIISEGVVISPEATGYVKG